MSYPVKLADLMARSLQRANLEGANQGDAPFVTDAELTNEINSSIAKWWDMLIGSTFAGQIARAQYAFTTSATGIVSNGVTLPLGVYPLPGDFARLISLDAYVSGIPNQAVSCIPYNEEQRNAWNLLPAGGLAAPFARIAYMIQYPNLCLKQNPSAGTAMQLNYFPVAPRLGDREDQLDSIQGWEEYVILDVAVKLLIKDGAPEIIGLLEGRRQEEAARIMAAAPALDQGSPERMHQTRPLEWEEGAWWGGAGW